MKIKLLLLIVIVAQLSCTKRSDELEQSWILVNQIHKPNSGLEPVLTGMLLNFDEKKMTYSHPYDDVMYEENYRIENGYIKVDTSEFGKILYLSKDSLVIEADTNSFDMVFLPLKKTKFAYSRKEDIEEQLTETGITFNTGTHDFTFYFDTTKWVLQREGQKGLKHFVYQIKANDEISWSGNEWWKLKEFKGHLIIEYSSSHIPSSFIQMMSIENNEFECFYINTDYQNSNYKEIRLKSIKPKSKTEYDKMKKKFVGSWQLNEVLRPTEEEIQYLKNSWEENLLAGILYEDRISILDLENKSMIMNLNSNGEFSIFAGERLIGKGFGWDLTHDLKFLYLGDNLYGQNIYEIISQNEVKIQLRKVERIYKDLAKARDFVYLDVEQEFIKINK